MQGPYLQKPNSRVSREDLFFAESLRVEQLVVLSRLAVTCRDFAAGYCFYGNFCSFKQ